MREVGEAVHGALEAHRDLLLDFLGGPAGPLRDDAHVVVGDVGVSLYRQIVERDAAPDEEQQAEEDGQQPVVERGVDEGRDHWSIVLWKTSAFSTTRSPGLRPVRISCRVAPSGAPGTTSSRRNPSGVST